MLKKSAILLLIYTVSIISGTFLYIASFSVKLFDKYDYLFFKSGFLLLMSSSFIFIVLILLKKICVRFSKKVIIQDIFLIFLIIISLNWFIYGMVPFNVSRSNSIIILKYLYDNNGNPKSKLEIKNYVENKYFGDYDAVGLRLSEQIFSGNIVNVNDEYVITEKGISTAERMIFISQFYNLKNNFLID